MSHRVIQRRRKLIISVVILLSITAGYALPALAQGAEPPPQETAEELVDFLNWLLTGAGALFLGAGIAFFAEHLPVFQRIKTEYKFPVVVAATITLSIVLQGIVTLTPPAVFAAVQPYWRTAVVAFFALVASQITHKRHLS
jgi:hypothetical protein